MVDIATPLRFSASGPIPSAKRADIGPTPALKPLHRPPPGLARVIESEIIPRLMLAHRSTHATEGPAVEEADVDRLVGLTLAAAPRDVSAHVEALVEDGLPIEQAYADLLAPAARRLGDLWVDDAISFTEVTVGLSRLQGAVRGLSIRFPPHAVEAGARSACFVTAPGEQHSFGLFLVEDRFRRAGWRTWLDTAATAEDAAQAVADDAFDVFGLSATSDASLRDVAAVIRDVRRRSLNPDVLVMVGGRLFIERPDLAAEVGADLATASAEDALFAADKAVKRPALA